MASSKEIIWNMALAHLKQARLLNSSNSSKIADDLDLFWEVVRDTEMAAFHWRFNKARAQLTVHEDKPDFGWTNKFKLKNDILAIRRVIDLDDESEYELEGDFLLCDLTGPVQVIYGRRMPDDTKYPSLFVDMAALQLARRLATPLGNDSVKLIRKLKSEYDEAMERAILTDQIERATRYKGQASPFPGILD